MNKIAPDQIRQNLKINWNTLIFLLIFHIGTVIALFLFSWKWLLFALILNWIANGFGVGIGFHRLLTHRGFKTSKTFEYFLTVCGMLALQGGAINWVATHRIHHAFTETDNDPHSPHDGGWWSHAGWVLRGTGQRHNKEILGKYAPDLMKDSVHVWLNRLYFVPLIILSVILFIVGGWPALLWGTFFRVTLGLHTTWLVNSATHMWGSRRFDTSDDSRNNWWVALLTFGEGWHNNHHARPVLPRHGLKWYEVDLNWYSIGILKKLKLIKLPIR